jgi:enoyl-[acyl-carrier protein] reductase I
MGFLTGKRALITGVASTRSIAYGIASAMHREGAELAFIYLNDKFKDRVTEIAASFDSDKVFPCDVSQDDQIDRLFTELKTHWDGLDIIIHSLAYAPADQLAGDYVSSVTREGFRIAHDVSSYSFVALAKAGLPMMEGRKGAMLTLTYLGSQRVSQSYNVMGVAKASLEANMRYMANSLGPKGIRVNAISAGAIKTLSACGIKGFRKMLSHYEKVAPLQRKVDIAEVGNVAAFLCSDLASAVTGDIVYVDSGFHCVGVSDAEL